MAQRHERRMFFRPRIWQQRWFRELPDYSQLLWLRLHYNGRVTRAGLLKLDLPRAAADSQFSTDELERYLSHWEAQGLLQWDREAGWLWLPTHMAAQSINGERLRMARQETLRLADETVLAQRWLERYSEPVAVGAVAGDNGAD